MEDWTCLGQHKRQPEFPVITRESRRNSRKTTWLPRHRKMKPFPATAPQEKSHVRNWRSKGHLAPLMRPTKFPEKIENEVEYGVFWKGTPAQYLDLLRTGYRAVKDADPNAQVVLAGIGDVAWLTPMVRDEVTAGYGELAMGHYNEWAKGNNSPAAKQRPANPQALLAGVKKYDKMSEFTHRLLRSDAAQYYDVIDLHAYHPYTLIPAGVRWLRAVMVNQGYSKPIWITETSGPNYPEMWHNEQEGERRQAEEMVKR